MAVRVALGAHDASKTWFRPTTLTSTYISHDVKATPERGEVRERDLGG